MRKLITMIVAALMSLGIAAPSQAQIPTLNDPLAKQIAYNLKASFDQIDLGSVNKEVIGYKIESISIDEKNRQTSVIVTFYLRVGKAVTLGASAAGVPADKSRFQIALHSEIKRTFLKNLW